MRRMSKKGSDFNFAVPGRDTGRTGNTGRAGGTEAAGQERAGELPDFSRMTKKQIKAFDDTEGSYKRLLGDKPISYVWLLNHYSKPNAEAYKAQQAAKKAARTGRAGKEKKEKTSPTVELRGAAKERRVPSDSREQSREKQYAQETVPDRRESRSRESFLQTPPEEDGTMILDRNSSLVRPIAALDCLGFQKQVQIARFPYRIGRSASGTDLCIADDPTVSSVHAEITYVNGSFYITDLNSLNHVYLDGREIPSGRPELLRDRVRISIGNEDFVFFSQT